MKLSYNWLNEFVDLSEIKLEDLAHKLTMSAFEVEEILASKKLLPETVVLGKIEKIEAHPDADKLQVTQTNVGSQTLQIVCGAKNIKVGQLVPVALVGASVISRHDGTELKIKESKIRGVPSFGMLCSPDELGFSEEEVNSIQGKQGDGIYILTEFAMAKELGTPISKVLGQEVDFVLEVGARSNRGDALSVLGQARELSAILDKDLKLPSLDLELRSNLYEYDKSVKTIKPEITATEDCSVFFTVAIEGVEIKDSPQWLKDRISAMGTKSINNVVDISNYVLLELGQPMHFYDREQLEGDMLDVRRAKAGEKIITLEEKESELNEANLVIADSSGPVSLAGVMGGLESSINANTKNLIIEVAVFSPAIVRKSSRRAGIESESKRRYERGVDRANSKYALIRAIELLAQFATVEGSKIKVGEINIAGSDRVEDKLVSLKLSQVKRLLGIEIPSEQIIKLLDKLAIEIYPKNTSNEELCFKIPSFRQNDISREVDLIEEIGRLYGFDRIPACSPETFVSADGFIDVEETRKIKDKIRQVFIASGYSEIQLSSLIGDSLLSLNDSLINLLSKHFHPKALEDKYLIEMDNPLSREHSVLRQSMIPGLVQAASRNYAYDKTVDIMLFEIGKTYYSSSESISPASTKEQNKLSAVLVKLESDWTQARPKTLAENFYQFKSVINNLYPRAKFRNIDKGSSAELQLAHPGISAIVEQDRRVIGIITKLHPKLTKEWDLPEETYVLELDFPKSNEIKFKPIATTPVLERDMTVDSENSLSAGEIMEFLQKNASKDLQAIKLVSVYHRNLSESDDPKSAKSTSFRLKWQSALETLSGEKLDEEIVQLKALMEKKLPVRFR
jgi:phenylalanyl-tRNA synthetase beta chain